MEAADLVKLITGGGTAAGLLVILYKLLTASAERWTAEQVKAMDRVVAAVDRIGVTLTDHTATDVEHHGEVRAAVVRLEGKIDGSFDERARTGLTPIHGVPESEYEGLPSARAMPPRARSEPGVYGVKKNRP